MSSEEGTPKGRDAVPKICELNKMKMAAEKGRPIEKQLPRSFLKSKTNNLKQVRLILNYSSNPTTTMLDVEG
jgi:hypothetical protein